MAEKKKTGVVAKKSQKTKPEKAIEATPAAKKTGSDELEEKDSSVAKAGRRSAKSIKESEEAQIKEERKKTSAKETKADESKKTQKPPRSKIDRAGKKYRDAAKLIDQGAAYNLSEALDLACKASTTKFDASVEMHINLAIDPKLADQNVRGSLVLPNGTGKEVRVAVFVEAEEADKAKSAGADIASSDELVAQLEKGQIEFDVLIAPPALMASLGKFAKLLGPRGLMPNPKSGTVTKNVAEAVKEAKAGKVEYRVDQAGIIHISIGKTSFGTAKLVQNAQALIDSVRGAKPASVKGTYIKSVYVTTTMGPSVKASL